MSPNRQLPADLVTFTEEILNRKLHFLCSVITQVFSQKVCDFLKFFKKVIHGYYTVKSISSII